MDITTILLSVLISLIIGTAYAFFWLWRQEKEDADYYYDAYKKEKELRQKYEIAKRDEFKKNEWLRERIFECETIEDLQQLQKDMIITII